jgi:putative FmdB family regulatory protein
MPTYDYVCKKCRCKFAVTMTISQHDRKKICCPKCKSRSVEQVWAEFFAVTSKKS